MQISNGVDIVEIKRILSLIDKSGYNFLNKHFTQTEISYCNLNKRRFAGRFAAKEAVYKALNLQWKTGFNWKDIEIVNKKDHSIKTNLYGPVLDHFTQNSCKNLTVSISYSREVSIAFAIVIKSKTEKNIGI